MGVPQNVSCLDSTRYFWQFGGRKYSRMLQSKLTKLRTSKPYNIYSLVWLNANRTGWIILFHQHGFHGRNMGISFTEPCCLFLWQSDIIIHAMWPMFEKVPYFQVGLRAVWVPRGAANWFLPLAPLAPLALHGTKIIGFCHLPRLPHSRT